MLKLAEALLHPRKVRNIRDLAMLLIDYAGRLRRSEVFALSVEDLERNADGIRELSERSAHGSRM